MVIFGLITGLICAVALIMLSVTLILIGRDSVRTAIKRATKEQLESELEKRLSKRRDEKNRGETL